MTIQDMLRGKRGEIVHLAELHGAHNVRLFGSAARGEARADSDLDFLVTLGPGTSLFDHIALIQDLEELLGRKVDVVSDRAVHWFIRERVMAEATPL